MLLALTAVAFANPPSTTLLAGGTFPYLTGAGARVGIRHQPRRQDGPTWLFGGDLAASIDPRDRRSATAAAAVGAHWTYDSGFGLALEAGLAFTIDHEIIGHTIDIGSGRRTTDRRWVPWLVPRVTARMSVREHQPIGGYLGITAGQELGFRRAGALIAQVDVGLTFTLDGAR